MKNGKMVRMYPKNRVRRFYAKLQGYSYTKVYFKVEYGRAKDAQGKMSTFYNDGTYEDSKEAKKALAAFLNHWQ